VTSETIEPMLTPLQVAELLALKGTDEVKERQVRRLAARARSPAGEGGPHAALQAVRGEGVDRRQGRRRRRAQEGG
jgi:hypothetical protein